MREPAESGADPITERSRISLARGEGARRACSRSRGGRIGFSISPGRGCR